MKIKDIKEIIKHYDGSEYDDWELSLWDYNNQREIKWDGGSYASSKEAKSITFPINVPPFDGVSLTERLKAIIEENGYIKADGCN